MIAVRTRAGKPAQSQAQKASCVQSSVWAECPAGQVLVELGQAFHCGRDEKLFRLLSRFGLIQSRPRVYDGTLFLCRY